LADTKIIDYTVNNSANLLKRGPDFLNVKPCLSNLNHTMTETRIAYDRVLIMS